MIAIRTVSERVGLPALLPDRRPNLKVAGFFGWRWWGWRWWGWRWVGLAAFARLLLPLAEVFPQGGGLTFLPRRGG
jgi:hypothetical protein